MEESKTPRLLSLPELQDILYDRKLPGDLLPHVEKDMVVALNTPMLVAENLVGQAPVRVDGIRMFLLNEGTADITVNLQQRHFEKNDLFFVSSGSIVQLVKHRADTHIAAFSVSDDRLQLVCGGRMPEIYSRKMYDFRLHLSDSQFVMLSRLLELLWQMAQTEYVSRDTVDCLIASVVHHVHRLHSLLLVAGQASRSREQQIFDRFISLVNEHAARQHTLDFYAARLCITQRYLGALVKQASGLTAKQWIDRSLVIHIKMLLKHSDLPLKLIADRLYFPNVSFFCKYFKRLTGETPATYRERK